MVVVVIVGVVVMFSTVVGFVVDVTVVVGDSGLSWQRGAMLSSLSPLSQG